MNTICLQFFTVEMVLSMHGFPLLSSNFPYYHISTVQGFKLIGYFPGEYIADPWNKFDAFVITLSWAAIAAEASGAAGPCHAYTLYVTG
jgi:hypothetical protein|eukprot:SAG25_NODE_609_length_6581_cov_50.056464_6_plen_89_part_00